MCSYATASAPARSATSARRGGSDRTRERSARVCRPRRAHRPLRESSAQTARRAFGARRPFVEDCVSEPMTLARPGGLDPHTDGRGRLRLAADISSVGRRHTPQPSDRCDRAAGRTAATRSDRSACGVQRHARRGSPRKPHGHGFIAPISTKRAGKTAVRCARAMRTTPSSSGCRSTSSACRLNSGISSRKSTPLCARLISPGRGIEPPPASATSETVWCGARNGRARERPVPGGEQPGDGVNRR